MKYEYAIITKDECTTFVYSEDDAEAMLLNMEKDTPYTIVKRRFRPRDIDELIELVLEIKRYKCHGEEVVKVSDLKTLFVEASR